MEALEYLKQRNYICDTSMQDCERCPLNGGSKLRGACFEREYDHPDEMMKEVLKWSKVRKL